MKHDSNHLTLEEMYKMEGEPVWVVSLSQKGEKTVHQDWFLVVIEDLRLTVKRPLEFGHYICGADTYGKTWLAYAQKPIDFDDWTAEWKEVVTHNGCTPDYDCVCSKCGASGMPHDNFCSDCGRAMNDEARQMLEKRLKG